MDWTIGQYCVVLCTQKFRCLLCDDARPTPLKAKRRMSFPGHPALAGAKAAGNFKKLPLKTCITQCFVLGFHQNPPKCCILFKSLMINEKPF